jgi:diguanylate cyclase (GGDEF)-like protein
MIGPHDRSTRTTDHQPPQAAQEEELDRLRETLSLDALPVELVSAFSGDRPLSATEAIRLRELRRSRGKGFFSDLLYSISHHYFAPEVAEGIWNEVLAHKSLMAAKLGRNVRVAVATLDYLSNLKGQVASFTLMSESHVADIVSLSMRDGLTGLFNHSSFFELLELELKNHRRYGLGAALILLDVDDFKSVNDSWGHQEGDRILVELAGMLGTQTRDSDICCRFGGEEFAVILPFTHDAREAFEIAERIRVGATKIVSHGRAMAVSAGVASCDGSSQTAHALVERADRALYRAKRSGKNAVVVSDGGPSSVRGVPG